MSRTTTATSITGYGVWHPASALTNAELCVAFNEFVRRDNAKHAAEIAAGTHVALKESSPEFIEKASGIKQRYVEDKTGLTDPARLCPNIPDGMSTPPKSWILLQLLLDLTERLA